MAKVRMGQKCAGGCGLWLKPGATAFVFHRNWWCLDCALAHKQRCSAHDLVGAK